MQYVSRIVRIIRWAFGLFIINFLPLTSAQEIGIWTSTPELATIPMSGPGWTEVLEGADLADPSLVTVSDLNSNSNLEILAAAIVYARTGQTLYRNKVTQGIDNLVAAGASCWQYPELGQEKPGPSRWLPTLLVIVRQR